MKSEICKNCEHWERKNNIGKIYFGMCKNEASEYYDTSISEQDSCIEFESNDE